MACLKLFSKNKAAQPQAKAKGRQAEPGEKKEPLAKAPIFQVETVRNPFPIYHPADSTLDELEDLVRKVSQDAAVRFKIACVLFEHKIAFDDLVFGITDPERSGSGGKVPVVTVLSPVAVNPVVWIMAAGDVSSTMSASEYGGFSVVIAPVDE